MLPRPPLRWCLPKAPLTALLAAPLFGAEPALAEPLKQADPVDAEALFTNYRLGLNPEERHDFVGIRCARNK